MSSREFSAAIAAVKKAAAQAAFASDTDAGIDLASDILNLVRRFEKACKR